MEGMKNWIGTAVAGLNSSATCTVRGAISFNSSTHLPPSAGSLTVNPRDVAAGMRKVRSEATADRIRYACEHDGNCPCLVGKGADHGRGHTEDRIGPQIDQLFCQHPHLIRVTGAPAKFDPEIAAFRPPQLRERTSEHCEPRLRNRVVLRIAHQHADQPHLVALLRVCRKRPHRHRATKERDEFPPPHASPNSEDGSLSHRTGAVVRHSKLAPPMSQLSQSRHFDRGVTSTASPQ